jgi:hypothetical protein
LLCLAFVSFPWPHFQAIAIGTSLGISLISGALCGFVLKRSCFEQSVRLFNDAEYFEVPTDDGSGLSVVPAAYASGALIQLWRYYDR